jgi:hypothetical protein
MTELHLFTAIFERENKFVDIQYYPYGVDGTLGEYQLTVRGQMGSEIVLYFDNNGKYKNCLGCTN